jgi:hypothetical protein
MSSKRVAHSILITHHFGLELVVIVVIVKRFFLDDVQFNRIQTDDFELNSTLFTIHRLALVHVEIHVNVGITFRTGSGRHFFYLQ